MTTLSQRAITSTTPPITVDFTALIYSFISFPPAWVRRIYLDEPKVYQAITSLGLDTIITCSFFAPSDIPDQEQYLWEFIACNREDVQEILESDYVALQSFELIVSAICEQADAIIFSVIGHHLPNADYGNYVFSRWLGNPMTSLIAIFERDPSFES